jgi:hypothetical protein
MLVSAWRILFRTPQCCSIAVCDGRTPRPTSFAVAAMELEVMKTNRRAGLVEQTDVNVDFQIFEYKLDRHSLSIHGKSNDNMS